MFSLYRKQAVFVKLSKSINACRNLFIIFKPMKNVILVLVLLFSLNVSAQCISGDCGNGYGTFTFASGNKYVGEWEDGKPTVGKFYENDGSITEIGE